MSTATYEVCGTTSLQPAQSLIGPSMVCLHPPLDPAPPYYFGNRIISELGRLVKPLTPDRIFIVTTPVLLKLYGNDIQGSLENAGLNCTPIAIEDGEDKKTFRTLEFLCEALVEQGVSKASLIIGFGGGCLTNIVGLSAALIFRGIRYVEMPTTLMGITDSCLSNKQAVNGTHGKNQFGTYSAPVFLFGDTHFLATEPLGGKKAALAEGIKNGLISDPSLVDFFESALTRPVEEMDELDFHELAYRMILSKFKILARDPSEKHYAVTLEYGHTFGHAIEFLMHGKIPHGFAVARGMCIAAELGNRLGYIPRSVVDRHYHLFRDLLGLDLSLPQGLEIEQILATINSDNKKTAGGTKYVLLKQIGECLNPDGDFQVFVDTSIVRSVLTAYRQRFEKVHAAD
jgi:3-dehydroquinate synthase